MKKFREKRQIMKLIEEFYFDSYESKSEILYEVRQKLKNIIVNVNSEANALLNNLYLSKNISKVQISEFSRWSSISQNL